MKNLTSPEIWFVTGSQHLYGPGPLKQVAANSKKIAYALGASKRIPLKVVFKALLTTPDEIRALCLEANHSANCAGLILWMHTFSPAKMWIGGLSALRKPFAHLHTQFNRDLPWGEIDMDFMNLNQAAHGDREAGFLHTRMRLNRKVVVGHWEDAEVQDRLGAWMRAARGWHDLQGARFARFGDNMRQVAVTEGDKVAAEMRFGFAVNGYGVGDLVAKPRMRPSTTGPSTGSAANTRTATRWRRNSARTVPGMMRCATARASSSACALSSRRAASRVSPPRSRICMACASCPVSPCSG